MDYPTVLLCADVGLTRLRKNRSVDDVSDATAALATTNLNESMSTKARKQSVRPNDSAILAELGAAQLLWDTFLDCVQRKAPGSKLVWKTYAGQSGHQCVIRGKGRNLAYLKPQREAFLVSMALSETAIGLLSESRLPVSMLKEITNAPKYPEGRPARVCVDSRAKLAHATTLFSIKWDDLLRCSERRE